MSAETGLWRMKLFRGRVSGAWCCSALLLFRPITLILGTNYKCTVRFPHIFYRQRAYIYYIYIVVLSQIIIISQTRWASLKLTQFSCYVLLLLDSVIFLTSSKPDLRSAIVYCYLSLVQDSSWGYLHQPSLNGYIVLNLYQILFILLATFRQNQ